MRHPATKQSTVPTKPFSDVDEDFVKPTRGLLPAREATGAAMWDMIIKLIISNHVKVIWLRPKPSSI